MTEQQENKTFVKMLKEFPKAFGRVSFRERLMLRAAFDYINEEVIDDLKANFDYVLEGKDLELQELKDHLAEEVELHLHAEGYIKSLEKENEELRNNGFTVSAMTEQRLKVAIEKGEQLEKENAELKHNKKTVAHLADCLEEKMKERIEELENQIEKMKCCFNCKHSRTEYEHCRTDKHEKWEIKENG